MCVQERGPGSEESRKRNGKGKLYFRKIPRRRNARAAPLVVRGRLEVNFLVQLALPSARGPIFSSQRAAIKVCPVSFLTCARELLEPADCIWAMEPEQAMQREAHARNLA